MFFKPSCTLIRQILNDNKSRALSVSVGQIFVRPPTNVCPYALTWFEKTFDKFPSVIERIRLIIFMTWLFPCFALYSAEYILYTYLT